MGEVWTTSGDDTFVPAKEDMGTEEDWQVVERDPTKFDELRQAFGLPPKGGKEPNQEPMRLSPIPAYEYPITTPGPERSKVPGTRQSAPLPVQLVRDPESVSPTRQRTRPFLPARREPEYAPVSTVHDVQTPEPPLYSGRDTQKQPKSLAGVKQKELTPVKETEPEKINGKLSNQPQNVNSSLIFPQPNFRSKLTKKLQFRGRKGRQRTNAEVAELLTFVQMKGVWPREISDQMQRYYKREYPEYFRKTRNKRKVHA